MEKNPKLIYLIEDDPLILRMNDRLLRMHQYEVEIATNGEEAISKFSQASVLPVLVLLDVMMPKVNGFDVLKFLKADERLKDIPVVMLTNLAGKDDEERAASMGAVAYLVKSQYTPKELIAKIETFLPQAQQAQGGGGVGQQA